MKRKDFLIKSWIVYLALIVSTFLSIGVFYLAYNWNGIGVDDKSSNLANSYAAVFAIPVALATGLLGIFLAQRSISISNRQVDYEEKRFCSDILLDYHNKTREVFDNIDRVSASTLAILTSYAKFFETDHKFSGFNELKAKLGDPREYFSSNEFFINEVDSLIEARNDLYLSLRHAYSNELFVKVWESYTGVKNNDEKFTRKLEDVSIYDDDLVNFLKIADRSHLNKNKNYSQEKSSGLIDWINIIKHPISFDWVMCMLERSLLVNYFRAEPDNETTELLGHPGLFRTVNHTLIIERQQCFSEVLVVLTGAFISCRLDAQTVHPDFVEENRRFFEKYNENQVYDKVSNYLDPAEQLAFEYIDFNYGLALMADMHFAFSDISRVKKTFVDNFDSLGWDLSFKESQFDYNMQRYGFSTIFNRFWHQEIESINFDVSNIFDPVCKYFWHSDFFFDRLIRSRFELQKKV